MSRPIVVVVLGMHRSFTSATARLVMLAGAGIAPVLVNPTGANPAGYWESDRLNAINDGILKRLGRSWHDWRPLPLEMGAILDDAAIMAALRDDLAQTIATAPVSVVKEPRLCRLFPLWRAAVSPLGAQLRVVLPIRPPQDVAASLESRDGLARPRALLLWLRHVLEAERASRGLPRVIVDATQLMADWRPGLARIIARLDLPLDASGVSERDNFIDSRLIHHGGDRVEPLPDWVAECHRIMLGMVDRDDDAARRHLDKIRARFDDFCRQFGDYVAGLEPDPPLIAVSAAAQRLLQAISDGRGEEQALDGFVEAAKPRPVEALEALGPVLAWHAGSAWTLRAVGRTALGGGNLVRASEALRRLDGGGLATPRDLRYLGWTLASMKRWAEALAAADRAVEAEPGEPGGLFLQASIHERAGDIKAARAVAAKLAERYPDFVPGRALYERLSG